ncbi:MAG: flagellar filament capping protein FliD [Alphaproteobacteria bacterium]
MATSLNLGSLTVDPSGRTILSGVSSGIDFKDAVDKIIEAKRLPAVRLETRVTDNKARIEAYKELRGALNALKDTVNRLRGAVSVDGAGDIFKAKKTFTSTFRTDGVGPSAAGNLVGVTVANGAAPGVHEIEVRRVATAHKVSSQSFPSQSSALGIAGTITVGGRSVVIAATDTLADVRDRFNTVNAGTTPSGVTASVVSVSATEHYLVLTKDKTGEALAVTSAGSVLNDLGISANGGATFSSVLQAPQTARITADGLIDPDRFETDVQASGTAKINTLFTPTNATGTFTINGTVVNYNAANDSLQDLATRITTNVAGVTGAVVADGLGVRLDLTSASPITVADTTGLLGQLGLDNDLVIERSSNSVGDLFAGVTLSLFQAEPGTTIKIEVEQDLTAAKNEVVAFVEAYNALRRIINDHSESESQTGAKGEESGVLFADPTLGDVRARLANVIGASVAGVGSAFAVLAQIGVGFVDNASLDDPLDKNTLKIDESKLDEALLNNASDVRRLFAFDFASSSSNVTLLDYGAKTAFASGGYTLNVGTIGQKNKNSTTVTDKDALLNSAQSLAATTSGQFTVNGVVVVYDITADTLASVSNRINASLIPGVVATVKTGATSSFIAISSANGPLALAGDTGDFLSKANFQPDTTIIDSANIGGTADGADDGTVTISGRTLTVTNAAGAEGLKLFFSGTGAASAVDVDFTVGLAADLFFDIDSFVDLTDGAIQGAIASLEGENLIAERRVEELDARLSLQRETLTRRFIAMETALQSLSRIRDQLTQFTDQLSASSR